MASKIFLNQVDSYSGNIVCEVLSKLVIGSFRDEGVIDENELDANTAPMDTDATKPCYIVNGTASSGNANKIEHAKTVLNNSEAKESLLSLIYDCDTIIYNITDDSSQIPEAEFVVTELHNNLDKFPAVKTFILISPCTTWGNSKPVDPEDPDIAFTEEDYRSRRPHPNFKEHILLEKLVTKFGRTKKSNFITYIVSAGLIYGCGENILHFLFKQAWLGGDNGEFLPIFGSGQNIIPTIHLMDLANLIGYTIEMRPKAKYILAVDESSNSLEEIVKSISRELGTNKIKSVTKEEGLLIKDVNQFCYDNLLVNLRMDPVLIKEAISNWVSVNGIVENIANVVKEYKKVRQLLPKRVCILGPPAVGKSTIADKIAQHYKIHHIKMNEVITEQVALLDKLASRTDNQEATEEDDAQADQAQELLDNLKDNHNNNSGRYDDQYIIDFYKTKLLSKPCHNQGFVLDGFPKLVKQATDLFNLDEQNENDDPEDGELPVKYNKLIMPTKVFILDANDEYLKQRIIHLPQDQVEGTHNTEEGFLRRLQDYRNLNMSDTVVINYFDENEIAVYNYDISTDNSIMMIDTVNKIIEQIGEPKNYGPTPEELAEIKRISAEKSARDDKISEEERLKREMDYAAQQASDAAIWTAQITEIRKQENEYLELQATPLRNYLTKYVMPTLTQALVEITKIKPDDPIDYLAEYLFMNNPQVESNSYNYGNLEKRTPSL